MAGAFALSKKEHLRSPADFRRVYECRNSASDRCLLIFALANGLDYLRVGLSVSRKVGNAVVRNRFRRLYREAFRLSRQEMPTGLDLILIPRSGEPPTLLELKKSLVDLVAKLKRRLIP